MIIHHGFRYKLRPTPEQEASLRQFSGVCRLIYNIALEQRAVWGRSHKINFAKQSAEATELRNAYDWIAGEECSPESRPEPKHTQPRMGQLRRYP